MPSVILFVDCDNQPASRSGALVDKIHSRVGNILCVFLAGNSHGEQVARWKEALRRRLPTAIIDSVVSKIRKESADAQLILKIGKLDRLFTDYNSVRIVVSTADAQILSAAEVVSESGLIIFSANVHDSAVAVTSLAYLDMNEQDGENNSDVGQDISTSNSTQNGESQTNNWRSVLFKQCKIHLDENECRYILLPEAANILSQKYDIKSREDRAKIFTLFRLSKTQDGTVRIY